MTDNRLTRIDIQDWMIDVFNLKGLSLFIYALIYAELEVSIGDLEY